MKRLNVLARLFSLSSARLSLVMLLFAALSACDNSACLDNESNAELGGLIDCLNTRTATLAEFKLDDPAQKGSYAVLDAFDSVYPHNGYVYPDRGQENIKFPGIVLTTGTLGNAHFMRGYAEHLASHGFVVLMTTLDIPINEDANVWANELIEGVERMVRDTNYLLSPIFDHVEENRIGLIGLSSGGAGALYAASKGVPGLRAVVSLATGKFGDGQQLISAVGRIRVPAQVQLGEEDCRALGGDGGGPQHTRDTFNLLTVSPRQFVELKGGNHYGYLDMPWATTFSALGCPMTVAPEVQFRTSAKYSTMWFETHLYETSAWQEALLVGIASDPNVSAYINH